MRDTTWKSLMVLAVVIIFSAGLAQAGEAPERFTGRLLYTGDTGGGPSGAGSWVFTLQADTYTTDAEAQRLAGVLKEKGQAALVDELHDAQETGWLKIGNSLGYHASVIRSLKTENGRIIRVITDRPIQLVESMNRLRTEKYPFGIIELMLGPDGKGEGRIIAAARIKFENNNTIQVESFSTEPLVIKNVAAKASKK